MMGLQILFQNKAKKLQKFFSHKFSQNIWRILPDSDPDSDLWAIELRDVQEKKVYFAIVDLAGPFLKWITSPEGTDWWTSLTAFSFGNIFLHNYRYPDLPEPTDLLLLARESGEVKWALPNFLLVKPIDKQNIEIATRKGDQFLYFKCDPEIGEALVPSQNDNQIVEQVILGEPIRYKEGNPYFERLASFIKEHTAGHQPISIDYLEKRPIMMFSYYIYEHEKTVEYLLVVTNKMERILHERLSEGRDGIGRSTMYLKGSRLVFFKNNNEFSSLTLS